VFRYADVQRVLSEWETFSSERGRAEAGGAPVTALGASLISTDPPRHRQLRALVTRAFTPRAVESLASRIQQISDDLLDRVVARGEMDLVDDFATPLPVTVIAHLLGIPAADRERFKRWSDVVVSNTGAGMVQFGPAMQEMGQYFSALLATRRHAPGEDLISGLLAAQIEGAHLTPLEVLGFCSLLLIAGNETTTNLIGNAVRCLDEHPEQRAALRREVTLLPGAIEEVLRYRSPVQSMFRQVARDTTLGDQPLRAGESVVAWIGAANRDPEVFADPDWFDVRRAPGKHLAFGQGIHFCLGAPLARLEARIALTTLLARLPHLRVAPGARLEAMESTIVYGVKRLPVRFAA
jgi:cytochrome P450